ncbi:MAG: FAD-dependent oxidoreductase [Phycisphaerales bacterium]
MSQDPPIPTDVLVIGGGIAGLWTLAALCRRGINALLLEHAALGSGQTIWSQGIIHGGVKYALTGAATDAARAISKMPEVWRACLAGQGEVDLRGVTPLSESQVLWTTPGVVSRFAAAVASRAIRTPVRSLALADRPAIFGLAPRGTDVYEVPEPVLGVADVLAALRQAHHGQLLRIERVLSIDESSVRNAARRVRVAASAPGGAAQEFHCRALVLTAGAGNEALAHLAGFPSPADLMQRRPLHMVMARGPLPTLYGHCLAASTTPRLTITTLAGRQEDERVWLIGGGLAEEGVGRDDAAQRLAAAAELRSCLPWIDFSKVQLACGRIDRAEGRTADGARPDEPVIRTHGAVLAAWPTKLALAPVLAERVIGELARLDITPEQSAAADPAPTSAPSPPPPVATEPWREPRVVWNAM